MSRPRASHHGTAPLKNQEPLRNLNFRRDVFDAAATRSGLEGLTPHELRHTAASLAELRGIASDASFDTLCDRDAIRELRIRSLTSEA